MGLSDDNELLEQQNYHCIVENRKLRYDLEKMTQYAEQVETSLATAVELLQAFVDKVDRGEARSKRTYAVFKQFLFSSPVHAARKILDVVEAAKKAKECLFHGPLDSATLAAYEILDKAISAQEEGKP